MNKLPHPLYAIIVVLLMLVGLYVAIVELHDKPADAFHKACLEQNGFAIASADGYACISKSALIEIKQ